MEILTLSKARIQELAKLKQKKYRHEMSRVLVEGRRTLEQLSLWGITAEELYLGEGEAPLPAKKTFRVEKYVFERICESEHPPAIAGLFPLPHERTVQYRKALYLEDISDPGNLGTIFRIACAFALDCLLLSPNCCEVGSPKVVRASLGAVYKVPFCTVELGQLAESGVKLIALDMAGAIALKDFIPPPEPYVIALGSEAHGLSSQTKALASSSIRMEMKGDMESLNAAVCAGIVAYQLFGKAK